MRDRRFPPGYPVEAPESIYGDVDRALDLALMSVSMIRLGFAWASDLRTFDAVGLRWWEDEDVVDIISVPADPRALRYAMRLPEVDYVAWRHGLWRAPILYVPGAASELGRLVQNWPIPGAVQ